MKVIICIGPPGSGKTTWTNNYIKKHPEFLAVSRDKIREHIYPSESHRRDYWNRKDIIELELIVRELEELLINNLIKIRKSFILDSTNCHIEDFLNGINKFGKSFDELKMENVSIQFKIFDGCLSTFEERVMFRDKLQQDELSFIKKYYDEFVNILNYIRTNSILNSMIL